MKLLGEGGIRPLEDGRCTFWEVWQFVEVEGKRRQKSRRVHGGKREAQKALLTLRDELSGAPHTRGDDPDCLDTIDLFHECSPHAWG